MQVMTIEQRKRIQEQYAQAVKPWNGQAWKPELTPEQVKQLQEDIDSGRIPF